MGQPMEEDRERSLRKARKGATPVPAAKRLGLDFWVPAKVPNGYSFGCRKHLEELDNCRSCRESSAVSAAEPSRPNKGQSKALNHP
jgi:hypothetical protein